MKTNKMRWGNRMIKLTVQFWTNNLPKSADLKTAHASGGIHIVANKQRGLKHDSELFNSMDEFLPKLKLLLERNDIKLIKLSEKFEVVDVTKI